MISAADVREGAQAVLSGKDEVALLHAIEEATNRLLTAIGAGNISCRLRSWEDKLPFSEPNSVLFMIRAEELYRNGFFDEAQKYEGLAAKHASNSK